MSRRKDKDKREMEEPGRVIRPGDAECDPGPAEAGPSEGSAGSASGESPIEALTQQLQRVSADYQNYQKRIGRQLEETARLAQETLARELLAVLDNFDHTLDKGKEFTDIAAVLEGVRIVYDHLVKVLASHGVSRIEITPGEPFDPLRHEAMLNEPSSEFESNSIVRELAAGYLMNGRAIRPAKVSVAKAPDCVEN